MMVNDIISLFVAGLESFVLRCPREVSPFLQDTLTTCLAFLKYDPNYCYEEEGWLIFGCYR